MRPSWTASVSLVGPLVIGLAPRAAYSSKIVGHQVHSLIIATRHDGRRPTGPTHTPGRPYCGRQHSPGGLLGPPLERASGAMARKTILRPIGGSYSADVPRTVDR